MVAPIYSSVQSYVQARLPLTLSQILGPSRLVVSVLTDGGPPGSQFKVFHITYYVILFNWPLWRLNHSSCPCKTDTLLLTCLANYN